MQFKIVSLIVLSSAIIAAPFPPIADEGASVLAKGLSLVGKSQNTLLKTAATTSERALMQEGTEMAAKSSGLLLQGGGKVGDAFVPGGTSLVKGDTSAKSMMSIVEKAGEEGVEAAAPALNKAKNLAPSPTSIRSASQNADEKSKALYLELRNAGYRGTSDEELLKFVSKNPAVKAAYLEDQMAQSTLEQAKQVQAAKAIPDAAGAKAAKGQARIIAADEGQKAILVAEEQAKAVADAKATARFRRRVIGGTVGTAAVAGAISIPLATQ